MKKIEGVVITAKYSADYSRVPVQKLIGPSKNIQFKERGWEVLSMNGLEPFSDVNNASPYRLSVLQSFSQSNKVDCVGMANICLDIAESPDEWGRLSSRLPYVLVIDSDFCIDLYGEPREGVNQVGYIPVSYLEDNGLRGWRNFEQIEHAHYEYCRQGRLMGKIANFQYRRVPNGNVSNRRRP